MPRRVAFPRPYSLGYLRPPPRGSTDVAWRWGAKSVRGRQLEPIHGEKREQDRRDAQDIDPIHPAHPVHDSFAIPAGHCLERIGTPQLLLID